MSRSCLYVLLIVLVVACVVAAGVYIYRSQNPPAPAPTPTQAAATAPPAGAAPSTPSAPGDTAAMAKPKPVTQTFHGCPASGDGGDPVLNTLKNRVDEGDWQPVAFTSLIQLTWPTGIEQQPRFRWSQADAAEIARHEGAPVQVEGYLIGAKKQGPESCNCHSVSDVDEHIWLADDPNKTRAQSIVIETTPRVRIFHPGWTLSALTQLKSRQQKVRISGWLMMDPEHPDQIGKTRGTIWEIHPIMQIEVQQGGTWKPLDAGSTGIASSDASARATIPVLTPENTATAVPPGSAHAQNAGVVHITNVFFDGKTPNESDEYVEITNQGPQPVNMTDWVLEDPQGKTAYKWEGFTIQPGQAIRVYTNEVHPESGGFDIGSPRPLWGNRGDVAILFDNEFVEVSRYAYGNKK